MFGQSSTPFGSNTGGFGQPQQNTAPTFGSPAPAGGGLFGSSPAPAFGAPSTGFGAPASTGFGAPAPATGGLFGGGSTGGGFGSTTGGFGAPAPAPFGAPASTGGLFGSTNTGTSTGFGAPSGGFGAPAPTTGGLFGAPAPNASPFGGGQQQQSAFGGGGFGSTQNTTSTFGAPAPSTGLFGAPAPSTFGAPTQPTSTFGAPAPSGGGLFGSTTPAAPTFGAPATGGLFGAPPTTPGSAGGGTRGTPFTTSSRQDGTTNILLQSISAMPQYEDKSFEELRFEDYSQGNRGQAAPASGGFGGFGSPAPASGGLFGAPSTTTFGAPSTGGFGSPAPAAFGATSTTTFGAPSTGGFGAPASTGGGLFGSSSPAPAPFSFSSAPASGGGLFGTNPAPAPFGSPSPAPFGSSPAPAPFGSTTGGFGASSSGGLFGSSTTSTFGSPAPAPSGGLFGSAPAPAFGAPAPSGGLFGSAPAPSAFGAPAPSGGLFGGSGGFGSSTGSSLFGSAPSSNLFGQPAPATGGLGGFGSPAPAFGAPAPSAFGMPGQQQAPVQYGAAPAQPQSAFPSNAQIIPPATHEVLEQQLRALENQKKELEKSEVWRGNGSKTSVSTPTSLPDPDTLFSPSRSSASPYTPRAGATKIQPRGFPKLSAAKSTPIPATTRRDNSMMMTPETHLRSQKLQLVTRPESLKPPSRLGGLNLDGQPSPVQTVLPPENVDEPPKEDTDTDARKGAVNGVSNSSESVSSPRVGLQSDNFSSPASHSQPATSPGFDYYQKVIGSTEEVDPDAPPVASPTPAKHSVAPKLTKRGYTISPTLEELSTMSEADLAAVSSFTIARPGYGKIEWEGSVDVRSADLDRIVSIESQDVAVYTIDEEEGTKPAQGSKLNRPAILTFYGVYPKNGGSQASDDEIDKFSRRIEKSTKKMGADFVSYDGKTGVWKIRVHHFSRYGLVEDESDEEDNTNINMQITSPQTAPLRSSTTRRATPFKPSRITLDAMEVYDSTDNDDEEDDDEVNMISDFEMTETEIMQKIAKDADLAFQEIDSTTKKNMDRVSGDLPPIVPDEVDYEDDGDDESVVIFTNDRVVEPSPEDIILASSQPSIHKKILQKCNVVRSEVDMSLRMGRSFRVGWLPNGSFIKLSQGPGKTTSFSRCRPLLSDQSLLDTSVDMLKITKANSVGSSVDNICPSFSLPSPPLALAAYDRVAGVLQAFASLCKKREEAAHAFKFLSYFFDDENISISMVLGEEDDNDAFPPTESRRSADVLEVLVGLCASDVKRDVEWAKAKGDYFSAILFAISGGDLEMACNLACDKGYLQLGTALSSSWDGRKDIQRHLIELTEGNWSQNHQREGALRILETISIDFNFENSKAISDRISGDWRRQLILRMLRDPDKIFSDIMRQFDRDIKSGQTSFASRGLSSQKSSRSLFYRLLYLFAEPRSSSVLDVLEPSGFSDQLHDFTLSFHLASLISVSYISGLSKSLAADEVEKITDGYALQLTNRGHWVWAVFITLFGMTDMSPETKLAKNKRAKAMVLQNYTQSSDIDGSLRGFLQDEVGIPVEWIDEALAYRAACSGNELDFVNHYLAYNPMMGITAFREVVMPNLFFMDRNKIDEQMENIKSLIDVLDSDPLLDAVYNYLQLEKEIKDLAERGDNELRAEDLDDFIHAHDFIEKTLAAYQSVQDSKFTVLPVSRSKVTVPAMVLEMRQKLRYLKAQIDVFRTAPSA